VYVCKCMCMSERRCGHSNKNAQSCDVDCDHLHNECRCGLPFAHCSCHYILMQWYLQPFW